MTSRVGVGIGFVTIFDPTDSIMRCADWVELDRSLFRRNVVDNFKKYRRTNIAEMRPYVEGESLESAVSVSEADRNAGSPKVGDMIARNPVNHSDQWLVAGKYFADNFEAA